MDRLKKIKDCLTSCVEGQMHNLSQADTQELGAAIDMIKDLEEAIYYHTITKAMNEPQQKGMMNGQQQQQQPHYMENIEPKYNSGNGRMYRAYYGEPTMYASNGGSGGGSSSSGGGSGSSGGSSSGGSRYHHDMQNDMQMMRNPHEGRSPMYRMMYMENKHANGHDTGKSMKDLENYMHELSEDITEMIENASQEEKQMLRQKISLLAGKIK